jgi:uncharacterized membrane protein YfcA
MDELWLILLAGFVASLADGALGMGFGPTSSSLLLGAGVSPAATSATVNIAKIVTGAASAGAHWRCGNVDRRLVLRIALPGSVGALAGVTVLTTVEDGIVRPLLGVVLVIVGIRLLVRFSRPLPDTGHVEPDGARMRLGAVAGVGGVTNGLIGAWGPVVTPYLLQRGVPPRVVVGSVNTAEVAIAVVSVGSLVASVGRGGVDLLVVLSMLAGGVLAAPLAAHLVGVLPARLLGVAVGTLLLATQVGALVGALPGGGRAAVWTAVATIAAWALLRPRLARATTERDELGTRVATTAP